MTPESSLGGNGEALEHDEEVWSALPNEPAPGFCAFTKFRDLGEGRTLEEAYRLCSARRQQADHATAARPNWDYVSFCILALEWAWEERAASFDRHQARATRLQESAVRQERARQQRQRTIDMEDRIYELESVIARRIDAALQGTFESVTRQSTQGGKHTREIDDKLRSLKQLCEAESRLARLSAGLMNAGAASRASKGKTG